MESWVRYTLDTFKNVYGLSAPLPVFYGRQSDDGVHISDAGRTFFGKDQKIEPASITWKSWEETELPILFDQSSNSPIIQRQDNRILISCDLLASSFYFLSGWHEYQQVQQKEFDRYCYHESLVYDLDIAHIPVVNYYFDILKRALEKFNEEKFNPGRSSLGSSALALTHDVDSLYSGWLEDGYAALKQGKIGSGIKIGIDRLMGKDTRFNLEEIAKYERQWNIRASYYFIARKGTFNRLKHADYRLNEKKVQQQIDFLKEGGHEIGIHGSKGGHIDLQTFQEELKQFNSPVTGGRYHYLNFDIRHTPSLLDNAGLSYDTTLGFAEMIGFRNGITHPFYLFDLNMMQPTNVLEIPMVVMDATLRQQDYMGLDSSVAFSYVQPLLQEISKFNGAVSILWHNGYFTDFKFAGWRDVLTQIIQFARQEGVVCSGKKVWDHYRAKTSNK